MKFKEWLNENDLKAQMQANKQANEVNPDLKSLAPKPATKKSTDLPKYKENKWQLVAMKWKHRWLEEFNAI